jgi:subtilase family serine protease
MMAAGVAVGLAAALATVTAAQADPQHTLPGSVPSWATASSLKGNAPDSDHVGFRVYLGWRNGDAAAQLATAVSTPGNPNYGHFLTPQQFRSQFAPSQSDVSALQKWLRDSGFTVDYTPANGHYVAAEGSVAQAEAAFGTMIGLYAHGDLTLHSPESALSVPANLSAVTGVVGLDDSAALVSHSAPPSPAFVNARPCGAYWAQETTANTPTLDGTIIPGPTEPWTPCGYTPSQLQGAYGLSSAIGAGNDGNGVTVAIIDAYASPTIAQDANQYASLHGQPTMNGGQFSQIVSPGVYRHPESGARGAHGPVQDPQGWYGEETLDVEAVHATAPGADILYVAGPNNYQDLDAALNHVVDQHLATIVTNSYGFSSEALPTGYIKPYLDTMIQGAATGVGIYFSSGDFGDETGGNPANAAAATPDWPASSPWVTAVGGTSLGVGASNNYLFETGWETGRARLTNGVFGTPVYTSGSGGGTSHIFAQPAYQAGVVPSAIANKNGAPARVVPDIAALGDPTTGMLVGQTQTFPDGSARYSEYRIGGTSLSSPLMAGMMALVQQHAGHVIGFANPLIYAHAGSSAYHDVVPPASTVVAARADFANTVDDTNGFLYSLRYLNFDAGLTIHTAPGYDDVTGVGSPNGASFLSTLG